VKKIILSCTIIIFSFMNSSYCLGSGAKDKPPSGQKGEAPSVLTSTDNPKVPNPLPSLSNKTKINTSSYHHKKGTFSPAEDKIEVVFYNVENLFDTEHDKGKNDWEFLPNDYPGKREACEQIKSDYFKEKCLASDWTEEKLKLKIEKIAEMFLREREHLPEILGLCEVENENVVEMLAKALGYEKYIVTNGPDKRGIDVAILYQPSSKLKLIRRRQHVIEGNHFISMPTRNILEGVFEIDGKHHLAVYVNHWPSQRNPSQTRLVVARRLKTLILNKLKYHPETRIVAMGDFNTISNDFPRPIRGVLTEIVEPSVGGDSLLYDAHKMFLRMGPKSVKNLLPRGTYFYAKNMEWNQLDKFLVSSKLLGEEGLRAEIDSFRIYAPSFSTKVYKYDDPNFWTFGSSVSGVPRKYNFETTEKDELGYSDHFPIILGLKF